MQRKSNLGDGNPRRWHVLPLVFVAAAIASSRLASNCSINARLVWHDGLFVRYSCGYCLCWILLFSRYFLDNDAIVRWFLRGDEDDVDEDGEAAEMDDAVEASEGEEGEMTVVFPH